MNDLKAAIHLFHEPQFAHDHFETLRLSLPPGRHWLASAGSTGDVAFELFRPSNGDLQAIVDACQGELARRERALAALAALASAEGKVP